MRFKSTERRKIRKKFYSSKEWRRLSKDFRRFQPLCVRCWNEFGKISLSQVTDHVNPDWQGVEGLNMGNLQGLCYDCHSVKSSDDVSQLAKKEKLKIKRFSI